MKQTVSPISQSIALRLDVAIAFEALILNRLVRLPDTRRKEWLRGLLVQGFQHECRALRILQRALDPEGEVPPSEQKLGEHRSLQPVRSQVPVPKTIRSPKLQSVASEKQHSSDTISFVMLRKVIG